MDCSQLPLNQIEATASNVRKLRYVIVDYGISGGYVARVLEAVGQFRGLPRAIRTDQGPEFTSRALDRWAYGRGIDLKLIAAGKPTQNAYIESFNGKFRDECLNDHYFNNLEHARALINSWRRDYNEARPHSRLGTCETLLRASGPLSHRQKTPARR